MNIMKTMNKDLLLIFAIIVFLIYIVMCKSLEEFDKKMITLFLVSYLLYIILHHIPNFEYYTVKYNNDDEEI